MSSLPFEVCVHPPRSSIHLNKQIKKDDLSKDVASDKNRRQYMSDEIFTSIANAYIRGVSFNFGFLNIIAYFVNCD